MWRQNLLTWTKTWCVATASNYNFLSVILCCQNVRKRRTFLNKRLFSRNAYNYEHVTRLISWPNSTNQFPLSGEQCRSGNGSFSTVNVIFSSLSLSLSLSLLFLFIRRSFSRIGRKREVVFSMWNIEASAVCPMSRAWNYWNSYCIAVHFFNIIWNALGDFQTQTCENNKMINDNQ